MLIALVALDILLVVLVGLLLLFHVWVHVEVMKHATAAQAWFDAAESTKGLVAEMERLRDRLRDENKSLASQFTARRTERPGVH